MLASKYYENNPFNDFLTRKNAEGTAVLRRRTGRDRQKANKEIVKNTRTPAKQAGALEKLQVGVQNQLRADLGDAVYPAHGHGVGQFIPKLLHQQGHLMVKVS